MMKVMVKSIIHLIVVYMILAIFLLSCTSAFADSGFSLNLFSEHKNLYDLEVDTDSGVVFIETKMPVSDQAFSHKYENDYYYSYIYNDILVIDYFESSRYPVLRTWITYSADTPLYFTSVSFILEGITYTFTDVSDKDRIQKKDHGYSETLLIRYGKNNVDFATAAMLNAVKSYDGEPAPMKMILHGFEDVEVLIPSGFWTDMFAITLPFVLNDNVAVLFDNNGTNCKITSK